MALDFPSLAEIPNQNPENTYSPTSTPKASTNGLTYVWNGKSWDLIVATGTGGGGIPEAPNDNFAYSRKNRAWDRNYYLSSEDNDTASGAITFKALTTHEAGVSVTGGDKADVGIGMTATSRSLVLVARDAEVFRVTNEQSNMIINGSDAQLSTSPGGPTGLSVFTNNYFGTGHLNSQNLYGFTNEWKSDVGDVSNVGGFHARSGVTQSTTGSLFGFRASLNLAEAPNGQVYSFFSAGNAPNFFKGDTYIGGDTNRNTFELWKSTLTEEQVEQLEAGTLVAPANVATPGDGEFVRQWWYDQQSAEDQALIDAGELEYPEHFQAANFTNTFALGSNTKACIRGNDGHGNLRTLAVGLPVLNQPGTPAEYGTDYAQLYIKPSDNNLAGLRINRRVQWCSANIDLVGSRNDRTSAGTETGPLSVLSFYNSNGIVLPSNDPDARDRDVKLAAKIQVNSRTGDIKSSAGGEMSFWVTPEGVDGSSDVFEPVEYLKINPDGKIELLNQAYITGTTTQADKVKGSTFSNNRPISCWKNRVDTAGEDPTYEEQAWATTNSPVINGGTGKLTASGGFVGDLEGTATNADSVKYPANGFGSSNNRRIACFGGSSSSPTPDSYLNLTYANDNAPLISGDGEIKCKGIIGNVASALFSITASTWTQFETETGLGALEGDKNVAVRIRIPTKADATNKQNLSFGGYRVGDGNGTGNGSIGMWGVRGAVLFDYGNASAMKMGPWDADGKLIDGISINNTGEVTIPNQTTYSLGLRTQGDDPTAFQTTYSLDEDGNQVTEEEYIGETLDLLTVINELKAEITTLKTRLSDANIT